MNLRALHGRLTAVLSLTALAAFISGAGFDAPASVPVLVLLVAAAIFPPSAGLSRRLEPLWRILAVALTGRALWYVLFVPEDVVLPMVDLLLLLLSAEALRRHDTAGDARIYALSFALLVASAAYRPGALFAVAFVAYVVLATLTLTVGHLARRGGADTRVPVRHLVRWSGASVFVLGAAVVVFAAFPRVSRGWMARTAQPVRAVVGFGDQVSLGEHGARLEPNPEVVLRVEFPGGAPAQPGGLYWRGRSYDTFDGVRWARTRFPPGPAPRLPGPRQAGVIRQMVFALPLETPVLFGLHPLLDVDARSRIRVGRDPAGDWLYAGEGAPAYEVVSARRAPEPAALRATEAAGAHGPGGYLQLPALAPRVAALADSLTAGAATDYDRVMAIHDWLRAEFTYTLDLPETARQATLEYFLFLRRAGHCEYFSTALAVLLRTQGIPARNVNGFLGGVWNDFGGFLAVDQNRAHSWVEVWFQGVGWVPFDATPAGVGVALGAERRWLGPLRFVVDGLEHRWGKWVLDYDLERQLSLVRRTAQAFQPEPEVPGAAGPPGRARWDLVLVLLAGGALVLLAVALLRRRTRAGPAGQYLRLRRAYERAGLPPARRTPPLAFLAALRAAEVPGGDAAAEAVRLYMEARFGGRELEGEEMRRLAAKVAEARAALRAAPRSSLQPS